MRRHVIEQKKINSVYFLFPLVEVLVLVVEEGEVVLVLEVEV